MLIAIDNGHGLNTPGKRTPKMADGKIIHEWEFNHPVALKLETELKEQGFDAICVSDTRFDIQLNTRCAKANNANADLFVSIHYNAFGGTWNDANGIETYYYASSSKGKALANAVQKELVSGTGLKNRGVKTADFYVLKHTKMPAILCECGFMTNKNEAKLMLNEEYQAKVAKAITKGICTLFRVQDKDENIPTSKVEYRNIDGLQVLITDPKNVYVYPLPGTTLREFGIWGINGTWQDTPNAKDPKSIWGLAVNNNKAIGPNSYTNSPKGYKRGTLIFYKDGTIEVKRINTIKEFTKPVQWAIGGGMLFLDYNPTVEGFTGQFSDVLRNTAHTGIGYKGNRVYMFVHKQCDMLGFRTKVKALNLDGAVFLDGGGSTQMNYKGKGLHSSRKLSHGVFLIEG